MFQASPWYAIVAASGVILGAVYMLWLVQRVFFGRLTNPDNENLKDVSRRELVILVPIVILIFVMGIFPNVFFRKMEPSIQRVLEVVKQNSLYEPPSADGPAGPRR
jgi:NADH-quinone oxidoreductase subunit M